MSTDEKALLKAQESMIGEISPFEQQSRDLLQKAEAAEVSTEQQLASAVAVKKQITAHRKLVQDTRLNITRRFDEVKKAIMVKEDEILLPLDEAQAKLGEKILSYQEEQERIRREERERIEKIVARVTITDVYRYKTPGDVQDEGERFKKLYSELKPEDQKLPEVKVAFTQSINKLADRKAYLLEQLEQEKERQRLEEQAKKQSAERAELERQKAANEAKQRKIDAEKERLEREKQRKADEEAAEEARKEQEAEARRRVKTGVRTITKFEVTDEFEVPREYCTPNDQLIRAAVLAGKEIPGVRVWKEKKV